MVHHLECARTRAVVLNRWREAAWACLMEQRKMDGTTRQCYLVGESPLASQSLNADER